MAFFTEQQVLRAAGAVTGEGQAPTVIKATAALSERRLHFAERDESRSTAKTFDIFLSHSSLDAIRVLGIYQVLRIKGYSVYLDRICDPHLNRAAVNRATGTTIRRRMTQCSSLFVATSSNTPASQWVPWELGFTDGLTGKAAVLPIVPEGTVSFGGLTYFELYPTVQDDPNNRKPSDLTIWDGKARIGTWGDWLKLAKSY